MAVEGGAGNVIQNLTVQDNVGSVDGLFGDGIVVSGSTGNLIQGNTVRRNGPCIEGPAADNNTLVGNTATGSGADGIVVLPTCADIPGGACAGTPGNEGNQIAQNMSHRNGTSGTGSGIRLFAVANPVAATRTTITENLTDANATNGIAIDAAGDATPTPTENKVTANRARDNGEFDGFDGNTPACGTNVWKGNDFATVNQPCVAAPSTAPAVAPG